MFVDLVGSFFIFEMTKWEIKNGKMEMMMLIERKEHEKVVRITHGNPSLESRNNVHTYCCTIVEALSWMQQLVYEIKLLT